MFVPAASPFLSSFERISTVLLCIIPYFLIYKCVTSKSSIITAENHWRYLRQYPYDRILFNPGVVCRTCGFLKPARSKHCSICKVCVAKHDHHCIWVMNCLGKGNYAYFVAMLLSVSAMLSYGAYLAYIILTHFLQNSRLGHSPNGTLKSHWSIGVEWTAYFSAWGWAIAEDIRIGAVGLLALLTAPLGWGLFFYHVYLIWAGMTTNESSKWDEWKDDIADSLVYKSEDEAIPIMKPRRDDNIEPWTDWPAKSKQLVVRSRSGQPAPVAENSSEESDNISNDGSKIAHTIEWRQVQGLHEIENLYDLGFWGNLWDIVPCVPYE